MILLHNAVGTVFVDLIVTVTVVDLLTAGNCKRLTLTTNSQIPTSVSLLD